MKKRHCRRRVQWHGKNEQAVELRIDSASDEQIDEPSRKTLLVAIYLGAIPPELQGLFPTLNFSDLLFRPACRWTPAGELPWMIIGTLVGKKGERESMAMRRYNQREGETKMRWEWGWVGPGGGSCHIYSEEGIAFMKKRKWECLSLIIILLCVRDETTVTILEALGPGGGRVRGGGVGSLWSAIYMPSLAFNWSKATLYSNLGALALHAYRWLRTWLRGLQPYPYYYLHEFILQKLKIWSFLPKIRNKKSATWTGSWLIKWGTHHLVPHHGACHPHGTIFNFSAYE